MSRTDRALAEARHALVQFLVRENAIATPAVADAFRETPRHCFVPADLVDEAYVNRALPVDCGQTISQPWMVAVMTELLAPAPDHTILEIGTGTGYQAAILARLCRRVVTVERIPELSEQAACRFRQLGLTNVVCRIGDGTLGWPADGPYDRILVTAGAPRIPAALSAQLRDGGIMVIPVGDRSCQTLLAVRQAGDAFVTEAHGACVFVRLIGRDGWTAD
ncbi:MAG TPA: protein-L-isoaspartate(D-aspartate) O-methyltransferase [Acidobacteriota bacterium]|nr:protein-L-isoaspartate(D-aspartate) O-methyltransferase [Acidobacteriota bacterium]HQF87575.1 protein-L-isoaspartate(D-aspartate) O-methyltransferase [Acidobacteriota bacterium]HQG92580.1 protein-L-isoaspartate(D-aspartate) O-methyltransferase [Acidobacteriota bacterium]HQK86593.1 protein-L-isoaspartate(D-aspartate) O-methyltransferase [Acidobacteriota bacterium]